MNAQVPIVVSDVHGVVFPDRTGFSRRFPLLFNIFLILPVAWFYHLAVGVNPQAVEWISARESRGEKVVFASAVWIIFWPVIKLWLASRGLWRQKLILCPIWEGPRHFKARVFGKSEGHEAVDDDLENILAILKEEMSRTAAQEDRAVQPQKVYSISKQEIGYVLSIEQADTDN